MQEKLQSQDRFSQSPELSMRYIPIYLIASSLVFVASPSGAQLLTGYPQAGGAESVEVKDAGNVPESAIPVDAKPFPNNQIPDKPVFSAKAQKAPEATTETKSHSAVLTGFLVEPLPASTSGSRSNEASESPVDFEADSLSYDETGEIVIASGNVIITQDGRILRADEVRYHVQQDKVSAHGNVVLNEENGDIHFAQDVEFNDKMKNGFVDGLKSHLSDGSRFMADRGKRVGGNKTIMEDAIYTPCEPCKANPEKAPVWRIRAAQVEHDQKEASVSYDHARFEVYGVPVAYVPYFSHPDGSIEQKSGFLAPSLGFKSEWGAFVQNSYYWAIAPDRDATFGLVAMTEQAPLGLLEYRQRWDEAMFNFNGGLTYSERTDESRDDRDYTIEEEFRGHIFADGLWDMNDKWRSGFNVEYASDDQYARQYDISNENVLETRLFAERFSGRDYALVSMQSFQDTRISELEHDQPEVLPQMTASFIGSPGGVPIVKGRWDAQVSMLNLMRDGGGQDVSRFSTDLGWKRRLVSDYGLVSDLDLSMRGDFYHVNDRDVAAVSSGKSTSASRTRLYPQIHLQSSYPVARDFESSQLVLEPIAAFTAAPEQDTDNGIPNEDSRDVQLDASNIFKSNRFSGLDAVEDETRVTYGMRGGLHTYEGDYIETFLGQSYRIDDDKSNPFTAGSGLEESNSDIVGYINGRLDNTYKIGYRFQLDNDTYSSGRHELDADADWNRFRLGMNYLYAKALEGTEIYENREQVQARASYYLTDEWQVWTNAKYDLGVNPGLRKGRLGLDYFGQCVSWSLVGVRNYTDNASGESDTEILFRIGLKNLGEFERTGLRDIAASE